MARKYTITIGTKNWSSWSLRGWLALKTTGAPFKEEIVQLHRATSSEAVKAVSPSGFVPILSVEDAGKQFQIWDSLAICEYLNEQHPQAQLWPDERSERARARAAVCEMHSGFLPLRKQMPMEFARKIEGVEPNAETAQAISRIGEIWEEARGRNKAIGPYLFGRFTIADCFFAPVVSRFRTYGVALPRASQDYAETMWAHPFMQEWLKGAEAEIADGHAG